MSVSPLYLSVITGVLAPIIVGLVTKLSASATVKVLTNMVVTAVVTLLVGAVNEQGYAVISVEMAAAWLITLIASIASYLGVYKPVGAGEVLAPSVGIGG